MPLPRQNNHLYEQMTNNPVFTGINTLDAILDYYT